jgi:hypothetical protein
MVTGSYVGPVPRVQVQGSGSGFRFRVQVEVSGSLGERSMEG